MKFKDRANLLASHIGDMINGKAQSWEVEPLLAVKDATRHNRELPDGCILLRVLIVADEQAGEMGRMELFVPVSKKRLGEDIDSVYRSVVRFIGQATSYRAETIGKVQERIAAKQ